MHTWRLASPPTCHLRPGCGPGLAPEGPIAGAWGRGGEGSEPKWRLFLEKEEAGTWRRRGARGSAQGVQTRRGTAGGGSRAVPPTCVRGQGRGRGQRRGCSGVEAGVAAGRLPAAPSGTAAGRGPGPGRGRTGARGAGSGRRRLRAALRTCALPPLPPLTVLLWGGRGGGELSRYSCGRSATGRDGSGGGGPSG